MNPAEEPLVVYYVETDDEEIELFYGDEDDARRDAISVTKYGGLDPSRSATISRVTVKGPSAMQDLDGVLNLLNRKGYFESTEVIATYTDGEEVKP